MPWTAGPTFAFGINDKGQIVGQGGRIGFLLTEGTYQQIIPPLAAITGSISVTTAEGINNAGQIVGWYYDSSGQQHGFLLDGGMYSSIDVPFAGASNTVATGIDDKGQVVGYFTRNGRTEGVPGEQWDIHGN